MTGPLAAWVFLRLLALIYFAAFASLSVQITGLIGAEGILPAAEFLDAARARWGGAAWLELPTLFWLDASDDMLVAACYVGMAAALALLLNVFERAALLLCYGLYLSLVSVGQDFTSFQWDMLLLESGFLALFLRLAPSIAVWLYRWLLFRFMFMGGVVKLASGDPAWRNLTALNYHFETQPLPSPLAWYAHHAPATWLQAATVAVFVIELAVPFLVFCGRRGRLVAAVCFVALQGSIILTGNYTFFNLLTIALCVFLLDDGDLRRLLGARISEAHAGSTVAPGRPATYLVGTLAALILTVCALRLWMDINLRPPVQPLYALVRLASNWGIVNSYGPFAVMTTERREIIVEGSRDGIDWLPYAFPYKPGKLSRPLTWNIPHQPRLDWQMWFAALGDPRRNEWLAGFLQRLKEGSAPVIGLLADNPFPEAPPRHLRLSIYHYEFTAPEERKRNGEIWRRSLLGRLTPE